MGGQPSAFTGKIARSAGTVSGAVMCSRVLGLIREQVFAGMFGAGYAYDAFVVAGGVGQEDFTFFFFFLTKRGRNSFVSVSFFRLKV